jgi:flagellar protein FliS
MLNANMSRYRESQITSSTSEETVLMLYDGAIRFLRSAISELTEKSNISEKALLIEKVVKIIDYLQSCLDTEKGGTIAENLNKLYDYMQIALTRANFSNDTSKMEEVLSLLSTVREGWNDVCSKKRNSDGGQMEVSADTGAGGHQSSGSLPRLEGKVGLKA